MSNTYSVCNPSSVQGWTPTNSFPTFIVKSNAGDEFTAVDQRVKKVCSDIETIISNLNSLKNDMGDNTGTTTQIEKVISGLQTKEDELKTKEKELIDACNQVVEYIYQNKSEKSQEAAQVAQTIANIEL